ncbi:MAG: hypothetical protein OEO79_16830 [Gemmatimonadota bacterium]|nr:hypothetical protein [Gemmatimonadota bacterium]MDH3423913.1 hypothetical protein [Gemmatimonadota bacterium]
MCRSMTLLALSAIFASAQATPVVAQADSIPSAMRARQLPRQHLSGPRFGFTTFTGDVARLRNAIGKESIMSQFGWQFETQVVSTRSGNQALMEWVVLVGGVEQDELNLSLSWLAGYRLPNGLEFGVGPNVSVRKEGGDPTTSMVIAGGATLPFGELYVPLNLAVAFAEGGPRITTLIGWIIG